MPTLAQCLRIRGPAHASLRRATGVNLHQRTTSFCRFVRELCGERRPPGVINGLSQHSCRHALNIQLFDHYQPEHHDQRPGHLVREIRPLVTHMRVGALQLSNGFLPVTTTSLAARDLALRPPQSGLGFLVVSGVLDPRPVGERGEGRQADIDACRLGRRRQRLRIAFDAEHRVPLSGLALDGDGLDLALDRAMQFDLDGADSLQSQFAAVEHPAAVAITGKGNAVITPDGAESRIAGLPALPDAAKERAESLIDAAQHVLTAGEVGERQIALGANLFQLIGLIAIAEGFTGGAVGIAALLKGGVVEAAGFGQLAVERDGLRDGRVEPVFEILPQLSALLVLDVLSDRRLGNVTHRADVITPAPKRRKSGFEPGKFFAQDAGSEAFELSRDVRRGESRVGLKEHVNVIRHDLKRVYRGAEFGGFLFQQIFQPFGHRAAENRLAVFRTPNQVVFEGENRAGVPSVTSVYHRKCLNTLSDTLQLNNVEFGEGIASKTRRCEIPLSAISRQSPFAKLMEITGRQANAQPLNCKRQAMTNDKRNMENGNIVTTHMIILPFILCLSIFAQTQNGARLERDIVPQEFIKARPVKSSSAQHKRVRYRRMNAGSAAESRKSPSTQLGLTIWRLRRAAASEVGERIIVQEEDGVVEWIPERVGAGSPLRIGERIRLSFESQQAGYLYVINREQYADGRLGEPLLIFPTTRMRNGDNQVAAGRLIEIPAQEDRQNFFTMRRGRMDQTGEQLIALITPQPLTDLKIGAEPLKLSDELVTKWEQAWGAKAAIFERASGGGKAWTRVEREAGADTTRRLTQDDPAPQTIFRVEAGPAEPRLIRLILRYIAPHPHGAGR